MTIMLLSTHCKTIYEPFPDEVKSINPFNSSYESNNTHILPPGSVCIKTNSNIPNILPPPYYESIQNDIRKKKPYNNIFLGLTMITLIIIYIYYSSVYDNEWNEPSGTQPSGGEKIHKSLHAANRCINRQADGTNLRMWGRYRQARNECKELIYYMKYGFMMEWLLNLILYSSIIIITIVVIYCIHKFQV